MRATGRCLDPPHADDQTGRRGAEGTVVDRGIPERHTESSASADAALVTRVTGGDRSALAALYDRHAPAAYSLAFHVLGPTGAEDAVHDAFVTLLHRPGAFDASRGSFRTWFLTVVHHRCLNLLRVQARLAGEAGLDTLPDAAKEPADVVVQRLQDSTVRDALQRLPAAQQEVLVLAYYGGLSQSALAERLTVPLGTVKARMRRGLLALRGLLHGDAPDAIEEA